MQFSLKKLRLRDDWTLPSFSSMFPAAITPDALPIDASMTLGGLPPLNDVKTEAVVAPDAAGSNEIVTAFASLDTEAEDVAESDAALSLDFQCRYRRGKCSQPRTLKKNGSMHSYCEYHRQLSVRNQRVFDQKKRRRQQELEIEETEKRSRRSWRQSTTTDNDVKGASPQPKKRPKRRRRTV